MTPAELVDKGAGAESFRVRVCRTVSKFTAAQKATLTKFLNRDEVSRKSTAIAARDSEHKRKRFCEMSQCLFLFGGIVFLVACAPAWKRSTHYRNCMDGDGRYCVAVGTGLADGKSSDGISYPRDPALAHSFYERGCRADNGLACADAAMDYLTGTGVAKSEPTAFLFATRSCDLRERIGCMMVGDAKRLGIGTTKDLGAAATQYQLACELGQKEACDASIKLQGSAEDSKSVAPGGALGYRFGASVDEVRSQCMNEGGKYWASKTRDESLCGGTLRAGELNGVVHIRFCDGRVRRISLRPLVSLADAAATLAGLETRLGQKYGHPTARSKPLLRNCYETPDSLKVCLATDYQVGWMWEKNGPTDRAAVVAIFFKVEDGKPRIDVTYASARFMQMPRYDGL